MLLTGFTVFEIMLVGGVIMEDLIKATEEFLIQAENNAKLVNSIHRKLRLLAIVVAVGTFAITGLVIHAIF